MSECADYKKLTNIFTRGSHHLNLSVVFITQNFFHKGKQMRDVTLNAQYIILCKNRRHMTQVMLLGKQLFPHNTKFFVEVYKDATKTPWSYLLIDVKPNTPEDMRLRTQILPNQVQFVYKMKYI